MADLAGQHRAFAIGKAQCGTESGAGAQYQCRERLRRIGVAVQGHQGIGLQVRNGQRHRFEIIDQLQFVQPRLRAGGRQRHRPRQVGVDQHIAIEQAGNGHHCGLHRLAKARSEISQDRGQAWILGAGIGERRCRRHRRQRDGAEDRRGRSRWKPGTLLRWSRGPAWID
ncbi:hypothetical protein G6F31_017604 [Rhizopus arrhizus]|nr:hypothetical protein G6F31_017604 [Rhizopus arrhizus]